MRIRLSKTLIDATAPGDKEEVIWDLDAPGLGLRVRPSGHMSFIYQYRFGAGRNSPTRKLTIGAANRITADEARKLARKYAAQVANGEDPAMTKAQHRDAPTVIELFGEWMEEQAEKGKHKPATTNLYSSLLKNQITPAFGSKKSLDLTRKDIATWHRSFSGKKATANRVVTTLAAMYSWATVEGKIPAHNPAVTITLYPEKGKERFLTAEEYKRLADTIDEAESVGLRWDPNADGKTKHAPKEENRYVKVSPYVIAAIRLFLLTGARLREILNLRWEDYDADRGILTIPDGKTGKQTIVLSSAAVEVIEGLDKSGKFIIAGRYPDIPRRDIKRPWERIREYAGLHGLRVHDLRHSFASVGVGVGLGLPIVGKLLGHKKASTTAKYAHLDTEPQRRVADVIGERITAAMARGTGSNMFGRGAVVEKEGDAHER